MRPNEPYGNTPLTTEDLATLGHPLRASDFNQDAQGRYWRNIRGQKTYYAPEWFDESGTFVGTGSDAAQAKTGVGEGFFKQGQKYNWTSGEWENPTNWANVIGTVAAGGVGAGIAAPFVAGAVSGAGGAGAGGAGATGVGGAALNPAVFGGALAGPVAPVAGGAGLGGGVASLLGGGLTVGDLIRGGTGIWSSIEQAGANKDATAAQTASTKYAADLQSKSQAEQLAFLRQQAAYDATVAEANRYGNYEQWAARQEMLGPVGQALGLPARRIPAYVPLPPNSYGVGTPMPPPTGTGVPGGATAPPPASAVGPGVSAAKGDIGTQVASYYQSQGKTPLPTSVDYWVSKWNEFGARDPEYFNRRLAQADEFGGGGGVPAPATAAARPRFQPLTNDPLGSIAGYLMDPAAASGTLPPPTRRSLYGSPVGSYL